MQAVDLKNWARKVARAHAEQVASDLLTKFELYSPEAAKKAAEDADEHIDAAISEAGPVPHDPEELNEEQWAELQAILRNPKKAPQWLIDAMKARSLYLELDKPCGGRFGVDKEGKKVVACSLCDRGCRGELIAPNAAYVCSEWCKAKYEELRQAKIDASICGKGVEAFVSLIGDVPEGSVWCPSSVVMNKLVDQARKYYRSPYVHVMHRAINYLSKD